MNSRSRMVSWALALGVVVAGCGEEPPVVEEPGPRVPATYTFKSRFGEQSSVAYTGQTLRHVLISDLKAHIGGLTARIDGGGFRPASGDVLAELSFFYDFKGDVSGDVPLKLTASTPLLQSQYRDISTAANLSGKVAGKDPMGQYRDWSTGFVGWSGGRSPDAQVRAWFQQLDELAVARLNGNLPVDPSGAPISKVYVTASGVDLQQLIQKFLDVAIGFSQGADDYLDDDLEGHGLRVDNTQQVGTTGYTQLEHYWDEGFGYFGAARDYGNYTDEELAGKGGRPEYSKGFFDSNADGKIDVRSEYNFGHSLNAAKRDVDSAASARTDFSAGAFNAFLRGRALITAAGGALSPEQFSELQAQRDLAISNWEKAIAASAVHYLNSVLRDMQKFGTADYKFLDHAKHWSELKGFALGMQFNRRSPLTAAQFAALHARLGEAPVLPNQGGIAEYKAALLEARELLKNAYQFDAANMGDAKGLGGW